MRKSGYTSRAELMTPFPVIDVRHGRPEPPARLADEGKALWRDLVESRRAQWFTGAEPALESYCVAVLNCRKLEAALRNAGPKMPNLKKSRRCIGNACSRRRRWRVVCGCCHRRRSTSGNRQIVRSQFPAATRR